jgi:hypothetical protein
MPSVGSLMVAAWATDGLCIDFILRMISVTVPLGHIVECAVGFWKDILRIDDHDDTNFFG